MKTILSVVKSKYFLWALIAVFGFFAVQTYYCKGQENERLETYNRQLSGDLTLKEKELQTANHDLGISKSTLVSQEDLINSLWASQDETSEEFEAFKLQHNLVIKSKDLAIAKLEQEIKGGTSNTNVTPVDEEYSDLCLNIGDRCVIAYEWEDAFGRVSIHDPNIFKDGDASVMLRQFFRITGEVWEQENGSLQTRRLVKLFQVPLLRLWRTNLSTIIRHQWI